jgi:hypothetical protein
MIYGEPFYVHSILAYLNVICQARNSIVKIAGQSQSTSRGMTQNRWGGQGCTALVGL